MADIVDLESLRKIHQTLMEAVKTAEAAVNAQLAQRRFWLEEICSNLEDDGSLQASSIWKRSVPVKASVAKKSTAKTASVKRKKMPLDLHETKPAKKPRRKKSEGDGTTGIRNAVMKLQPKRSPTIKIKMRTSSLSSDIVASSVDSEDTLSQREDDEDSAAEDGLLLDSNSYIARKSSDQNSDGDSAANNPLELMAAVAVEANTASYPPATRIHENPSPVIAPRLQLYSQNYAPHGVRTYTSLEDVGASDDESDQDKF